MNSELKEFFTQERARVFTPASDFSERVMFRLQSKRTQPQTFSDALFAASWSVLATGLAGFLIFIGIGRILPVVPSRGPADIYAESELQGVQQAIYMDVDTPSTPVVFQGLISEDGQ